MLRLRASSGLVVCAALLCGAVACGGGSDRSPRNPVMPSPPSLPPAALAPGPYGLLISAPTGSPSGLFPGLFPSCSEPFEPTALPFMLVRGDLTRSSDSWTFASGHPPERLELTLREAATLGSGLVAVEGTTRGVGVNTSPDGISRVHIEGFEPGSAATFTGTLVRDGAIGSVSGNLVVFDAAGSRRTCPRVTIALVPTPR